ncbi:hypothetical protein FRC04_009185 [Tulasnella sp. 424]|nr:hypothetical protein FRC04_009185 [Tulasnella sp. 424]
MTADETLKRYTIVSSRLQTRRVNWGKLPEEVERLTAAALVFEHCSADTRELDEVSLRQRARLSLYARIHILRSNTRNISIVLCDREADAEVILRNANGLPEYTIRRIQRARPAPDSSTSPEIRVASAAGRLTELEELQWYLKAMFHHRREERDEEESRNFFKGSYSDKFGTYSYQEAGPSNLRQNAPDTRRLPADITPFPPAHPLAQHHFPVFDARRPHVLPSPSTGYADGEDQSSAGYRLLILLVNIAVREALNVALEGVPLLESMQNSGSAPVLNQFPILPRGTPIEPHIVSEFERIILLRRNVPDPTHPDIVTFDARVRAAVFRAGGCIQRGQ